MSYVPPHLRNKNNDNNSSNNGWSSRSSFVNKYREESSETEVLYDEEKYYKDLSNENNEKLANFAETTRAKVICATDLPLLYSFNQLKLPNNMYNYFKNMTPTEIQTYAIPAILRNKNVMCKAPTGVGKTIAFLVPLMLKLSHTKRPKLRVLILTPTRELAMQIKDEADKLIMQRSGDYNIYLEAKSLYGGTPYGVSINQLSKGCDILIATPGRLVDFLNKNIITLKNVKFFVLDEADRMLEMGFEKEMNIIKSYMKKDVMTYLFSATYDKKIMNVVNKYLGDDRITIEYENETLKNIKQEFILTKRNKEQKLLELIKNNEGQVLVFVERKSMCSQLEIFLGKHKFPAVSLHGDKVQYERESALKDFANKRVKILIATSVAARGLHISNISLVINYDMPSNISDYIHRIGRSGRCGAKGRSVSLFEEKDFILREDIIGVLNKSENEVPAFLMRKSDKILEVESKVRYMSLERKHEKRSWGGL